MREEELRAYRNKAIEKDRQAIENRLNHAYNQGFEMGRQMAKPSWIPVSEKVPEIFADVLCCTDSDEIFIAKYWGKMNDGTDCFDDDDGMMQEGDLIAWMPLPQKYKAEVRE